MTTRFFPVSVCIRGDVGLSDRNVIDELNEILRAEFERTGERIDRYQLQPLDPAQFVMEIGAAQRALGIKANADVRRDARDKKHVIDALAEHISQLDECEDPDADDQAAEVRLTYERIAGESYRGRPIDTSQYAAYRMPKVTITRTGYDPALGSRHPNNQDPTLEGFVAKGMSAQAAVDAAIANAEPKLPRIPIESGQAPQVREWEPPGGLKRGPRVTPRNGRKKKR